MRVRLRDRLEYAVLRAALGFTNLVPDPVAYGFVSMLGRIYFRCSPRRQRYGLRLLRNAYPTGKSDGELLKLARVATGNVFKVSVDMVRAIPLVNKGRFMERVELGDQAKKFPESPFLLLTGHLGAWEMIAIATAQLNGESHAIARAFKNPLLQAYVRGNREKVGYHVHPKRGGIRGLIRAMERGCVGIQAVDQNQRLRGVFVPFFGEVASTERAAATLALRKGYPMVVASIIRIGGGFRFRFVADEPFHAKSTGNLNADVTATAAEINRRLERHILASPEQYLWIHDRYRRRPESELRDERADPSPVL